MRTAIRFLALGILVLALGVFAAAQVSSTSSINGTVKDNTGAVVPGAEITVTNTQTTVAYKGLTDDNGNFNIPALPIGIYKLEAAVPGFKTAVVEKITLESAIPATANMTLQVGEITEQVTVSAGSEVVQTTSTNVATTISGRQIIELPFASRDALDLVLFLPGTVTTGRPRTSSFQGLPKGALNITTDGVNVQDNVLKSSDGFFTYIRPRIDAIDQVSVSTATPGAESAGEGAVQIRFVTRAGNNDLDGSIYWYRRTTGMNSNFFFNNQPGRQQPRATNNLLQVGFRVGGPVIKNKFFFFANYEEFRLPEAATRTRTIYSPSSEQGIFLYPTGPQGGVNVLTLAASKGFTSTIDPILGKVLSDFRASTSKGVVSAVSDPSVQSFTFTNQGGQTRRFPTIRLDWEVSEKHHIENIWNYNDFAGVTDFLNNVDPAYPGSPIFGSQASDRFSNVTAWRWALSPRVVNEARFGLTGGTVVFFPEVGPASFTQFKGHALNFPSVQDPQTVSLGQRRNAPVFQFIESLHWSRKSHSMSFGTTISQVDNWNEFSTRGQVPQSNFGVAATDPALEMFVVGNFPGATPAQLGAAANLYSTLTGLLTSINYAAAVAGDKFDLKALQRSTNRQREFGVFGQDTWKVSPSFTLNYGLRWEVQFPPINLDNSFTKVPFEDLYGVSGPGNLFKPGTLTGRVPVVTATSRHDRAYKRDYNNFAPSLGFAWSPNFGGGASKLLFGEAGQTVLRAAYSIAFNREGGNVFNSIWGSNPGAGSRDLTLSVANGTMPAQTYFRNALPAPASTVPRTFPLSPTLTESVNAFDPDLTLGYVESWTVGIQRELNRDTALEFRYVGNRGVKLWRQYSLNEANIFENGFLTEFLKAQQNLAINLANGRGATFQNLALPGQSPLPIFEASFGTAVGNFTSQAANVSQGRAGSVANTLALNSAFQNNRVTRGLASNLFIVNPSVFGDSFLVDNGGRTQYDGLQIEVRRRMSRGLLVQGSYTWAKALSNLWASSSVVFAGYDTLRDTGRNKGISPFDLRHALKANWIYELPFGPGTRFQAGNGFLDRIIGGWAMHGTMRLQSGRPHLLSSGRATVNQNDSGVVLVGLDRGALQSLMKPSKNNAPGGALYFLPQGLINSSLQAQGLLPGTPGGAYIGPPTTPGRFGGRTFLYGPRFHRWDISAVKKTQITEGTNLELRVEFMNAFNSSNIMLGNPALDLSGIPINTLLFGQTTSAYQDLSTTNDPGGRMIQLVARINF
ncbi:MAG: carboxypeptidase regulatory-like domain-containing protein [Acidobacteriota bacterium]